MAAYIGTKQDKTSVHLSPTLKAVHQNLPTGKGFGGRLTAIVDRYNELMRLYLPRDIPAKQWGILMTVLKDKDFHDHPQKVTMVEQYLRDYGEGHPVGEMWGNELWELIARVNAMSYPSILAVVHYLESEKARLLKK